MPAKSTPAHFWRRVQRGNGCWEFKGHRTRDGYGRLSFRGDLWLAHRLAWMLKRGPIPVGLKVLHECDNPICCRISHLFIGTQADNVRDCISKGRAGSPPDWRKRRREYKGSDNPRAVLDEGKVLKIRELFLRGVAQKTLAEDFGVSTSTIERISTRRLWTHI